jgi:GNAT superfamily N-acetyltransferase
MLIRLAHTVDLPALMALMGRIIPLMQADGIFQWDDTYPSEQDFANDIQLGQLWVAEQPGALAGVVAITTDQYPEYVQAGLNINEEAMVAHRLAVDPAYRGTGVGVALMQQVETVARANGVSVLRVDTNTQNPATQRLLPKLGYTLAGEIGLSFRPGLRFLCYERRLDLRTESAPA